MQQNLDTKDRLTSAVESLYQTFGKYALKPHIIGCPCCTSETDYAMLLAKPLRKLTGDDLYRFSCKAMTTWGEVDDFKHFLPRLFELSSMADNAIDEFILAGKLEYGKWRTWPIKEQDAIREFLHVWWLNSLTTDPQYIYAENILCAIAQIESSMEPYLSVWRSCDSINSMRHIANSITANTHCLIKDKKLSSDWSEPCMKAFITWLLDIRTEQVLEKTAFENMESDYAEDLLVAVDSIRTIRNLLSPS